MIRQKVTIRQIIRRQCEFLSDHNAKMLVEILLALIFSQSRGKCNGIVVW